MKTFRNWIKSPALAVMIVAVCLVGMGAGINGHFTSVDSANGYKVNGTVPSSGNALCSDGTYYNTPCAPGAGFYQFLQAGGITKPQRSYENFAFGSFALTDDSLSNRTNIDLASVDTPGSCTNCAFSFDTYGRVTAVSSGRQAFAAIWTGSQPISAGGFASVSVLFPSGIDLTGITYSAACSPVSATTINPGALYLTEEAKGVGGVTVTFVTGQGSQAQAMTITEVDCSITTQ